MPSPQAQVGLQTAPTMLTCAVAAVVTSACVTAVDAAGAVIDAAGGTKMGCTKTLHCAIQHVRQCASGKCKSVILMLSMPF